MASMPCVLFLLRCHRISLSSRRLGRPVQPMRLASAKSQTMPTQSNSFQSLHRLAVHISTHTLPKRSGRDSNPAPASSARCHRDLSSPVRSCHNLTGCSGGDPVFRSADHLLWLHASSGFHHQPADRVSNEGFPESLTTSLADLQSPQFCRSGRSTQGLA